MHINLWHYFTWSLCNDCNPCGLRLFENFMMSMPIEFIDYLSKHVPLFLFGLQFTKVVSFVSPLTVMLAAV